MGLKRLSPKDPKITFLPNSPIQKCSLSPKGPILFLFFSHQMPLGVKTGALYLYWFHIWVPTGLCHFFVLQFQNRLYSFSKHLCAEHCSGIITQNFGNIGIYILIHPLRVRAFFHETVRVCHVYCNFKIGFTCRITVIFGTLNGGSLLINTLASNICFSYRNMFQNGVDALSKIVDAFWSKSSKFHLVRIIR